MPVNGKSALHFYSLRGDLSNPLGSVEMAHIGVEKENETFCLWFRACYLFILFSFFSLHWYSLSRKFRSHQKKLTYGQRQFCYRGEAGVGEKVMGCCQECSSCTQQFCDTNVILCPCQTAFLPAQTDVGALLLALRNHASQSQMGAQHAIISYRPTVFKSVSINLVSSMFCWQ